MALNAAAALGRAALTRAASKNGRAWKLLMLAVAVIVAVALLVQLAFYTIATHVLAHVYAAPPGFLAVDAYRAAEDCPFATSGDVGRAFGTAFLIGAAWVMTSDGGSQYGGYRNPAGSLSEVPPDMRPTDPGELGPGGAVYNELDLQRLHRTVQPQDWTSVVGLTSLGIPNPVDPTGGEHGVGFLLIPPSDWRAWEKDVPASIPRPLDPYQPYDAFVVMACHLQAVEHQDGLTVWGALARWAVTQVLSAEVNRELATGPEKLTSLIASIGADMVRLGDLGTPFENAVASFMGVANPAVQSIPAAYLPLIKKYAAQYGLDWTLLAAVLQMQCDFGQCFAAGTSTASTPTPSCTSSQPAQMSFNEIVSMVQHDIQGISQQQADIAAAIAMAESGGNTRAYGDRTIGGSWGLWQVFQPAHPGTMAAALCPDSAVQLMWQISVHGTSWTPWSTYNSGAYLAYLSGGGSTVPAGSASAMDPAAAANAVASTAKYLKALGAGNPATQRSALCKYFTASDSGRYQDCMSGTQPYDYADQALAYAQQFVGGSTSAPVAATLTAASVNCRTAATGAPGAAAQAAVLFACAQIGKPYLFGGIGPNAWDCSGLVQAAYRTAGIQLPRTSGQQWAASPHLPNQGLAQPNTAQLKPGDLVFFTGSDGTVSAPGHVAIVISPTNEMIAAPSSGTDVQEQPIYGQGSIPSDFYVGATRPWA